MASYFDPKYWSPSRAAGIGKGWLDQFMSATAAVTDPVAVLGAGTVTALMPDVVLSALTEGLLRRYRDRAVDLRVQGSAVKAVLTSLNVARRGSFFQARVDLTDVVWQGRTFAQLTVIANGVRLVPGVPTRLRADQLDITGTTSIATVVDSLAGRDMDWDVTVVESGLLAAEHRRRNITAIVDAAVVDDLVKIDIKSARWHGVPIPRIALPQRAFKLAPLPRDARVVRAERIGHTVRFVLDVPDVHGSLDLGHIRDAIVAGTGLIVV